MKLRCIGGPMPLSVRKMLVDNRSFNIYTWELEGSHVFREYIPQALYPFLLSRCLNALSGEELAMLRGDRHYFRIFAYEISEQIHADEVLEQVNLGIKMVNGGCYFSSSVLDIDECSDEMKQVLDICSSPCPFTQLLFGGETPFPCEIRIGSFIHLFKVSRECLTKKSAVNDDIWLVCRSMYPEETTEDVARIEEEEGIIVIGDD